MNYEEKYEQAMLRMNKWVEGSEIVNPKEVAEFVFPELKDSEDEKIRKELIKLMKQMSNTIVENYTTIEISTFVDWLEKQGEQNHKEKVDEAMREIEEKARVFSNKHKGESSDEILEQMRGEQKPVEWSAYDKATLEYIIEDIKELCDNETEEGSIETYNRELNLLQAINESIKLSSYTNPAAWSEEDERIQQCLIEDQERGLEAVINSKVGHSEIISDLKEMYHERLDWLKSLKERYTWKPNRGQIEAIEDAIKFLGCTKKVREDLKSLYEQLKKLRGECN